MMKVQRVLLVSSLLIACAVALSAPGGALAAPAKAPGAWCGGTLWKLMTLSDSGRVLVKWAPAASSVADIANVAAPGKTPSARTTPFQKQVWQVSAVVDQYRIASNGEVVLVLFDPKSGKYMDAYVANPQCLSKMSRGRADMLAARAAVSHCPKLTTAWQPLGAAVEVSGVGFWNPSNATKGALTTGAELRPVVALKFLSGCGTP